MSVGLEVAWAAGFLDGEGTFYLRKISNKNQRTPSTIRRRAQICAVQTRTREPLDRLQALFGGRVRSHKRLTASGYRIWEWHLDSGSKLELAIDLLLPHLTVKRFAALTLREHRLTFKRSGPIPLTVETLATRARLEEALQAHQSRPRVLHGGAA